MSNRIRSTQTAANAHLSIARHRGPSKRTQSEPWYRSIQQTPSQRIFVALVKALNAVAIVAFVTDLHPGAQRPHGRKFLDRESDSLRCGRKPAIAQLLTRSTLTLGHEQLGRCAVVEFRGLVFGRQSMS